MTNPIDEAISWEKPGLPESPQMVYLGGPIDFAPGDARGWRETAAKELLDFNIASFSPAHAFRASGEAQHGESQRLMAINFAAVYYSDVVLINLGTTMSVGTSREIHQAILWGKPVVVILEGKSPGHYLVDCWITKSLDEAIGMICYGS